MEKLIYISGSGKSGSTLLDIILGSKNNAFSIGELHNLFRPGLIEEEHCTCKKQIHDCAVWSEIIGAWKQKSKMKDSEYYNYQQFFRKTRNYNILKRELKNPGDKFSTYLNDTKLLYELISEVTGCEILIDSSKSLPRALILDKIFNKENLVIIHLINKFSRVLNSNKKVVQKDLKIGREKTTEKKGVGYVFNFLPRWLLTNFLLYFEFRKNRKVIVFEDYIFNPNKIANFVHGETVPEIIKYNPQHIMAGNHMRMKNNILIDKSILNKPLTNLNLIDQMVSKIVDSIFYNFLKNK